MDGVWGRGRSQDGAQAEVGVGVDAGVVVVVEGGGRHGHVVQQAQLRVRVLERRGEEGWRQADAEGESAQDGRGEREAAVVEVAEAGLEGGEGVGVGEVRVLEAAVLLVGMVQFFLYVGNGMVWYVRLRLTVAFFQIWFSAGSDFCAVGSVALVYGWVSQSIGHFGFKRLLEVGFALV